MQIIKIKIPSNHQHNHSQHLTFQFFTGRNLQKVIINPDKENQNSPQQHVLQFCHLLETGKKDKRDQKGDKNNNPSDIRHRPRMGRTLIRLIDKVFQDSHPENRHPQIPADNQSQQE